MIIDEAQDLHPTEWHLLRAAVPPGPDDMFIVGDAHQRIYDNHVSLAKVGINVRGRSPRLTVNYRAEDRGHPGYLPHGQVGERRGRVGTMHRMKRLEFQAMAVIGVADGVVPAPAAVTPAETDQLAHAEDLQRERCLLFVACTRVRDHLYVSYSGSPSPFLAQS